MGSCLSVHSGAVTRCPTSQNPLEPKGEDVTTTDKTKESSLSAAKPSCPRSEREPWKSFLGRDYWRNILVSESQTKSNSEFIVNLYKFAKGDFRSLPVEHAKVFAVFVSSTFTDTEEERNLLVEDVQPYLRELCSLFGYEFRFCEMRWGVREEASEDHQTVNLCMEELSRCQRESCGVNFITFLCDKYGYCPFPASIPEEEFNELLSYIDEEKCRSLLLMWFKKDENLIKPAYILQKISSIIDGYNEDNHEKRKKARDKWWSEFEIMQTNLKSASSKLLNVNRRKYYEISVTELEVLKGLLEIESPEKTAFAIRRNIKGMEEMCREEEAGKFIDIDWSSKGVNQESRERLDLLKNEKVPKVLKNNIKDYDIEWSVNGIKRDSHEIYLQGVIDVICQKVFDSIKEHFMQKGVSFHIEDSVGFRLEKELRKGAVLMERLSKFVVPRDDILQDINHYIFSESSEVVDLSSPLIISGKAGSGKSTIIALSIMKAVSGLKIFNDSNLIFRFIGTTPESGETKQIISSLLNQFHIINGATTLSDRDKGNIELLAKRLQSQIKEEKRKTLIFLDALDQLSDVDSITELEWLPTALPSNVRLIVSCTPCKSSGSSVYFQYLKSMISSRNFISVTQLSADTCGKILSQWLEMDERTLSHIQMEVLEKACRACPLPLFLKIAYDETRMWHSYDDLGDQPLKSAISIEDLIYQLYERLAITHGKVLFERGLAYLTAAKDGLSRQELEDILSCDDDILNDIFQWWVPPIRRIPQLQVVRLLSDLKDYLVETDSFSDGVPLLRWFHRQFKETTMAKVKKSLDIEEIHKHMANYFGGTWATTGKPYKDRKKNDKEVFADRKIPRNRLIIQGKLIKCEKEAEEDLSFVNGNDCKINLRKMNEHCYHLIKGGMLEDAANSLCNLEYIHSKLKEKKQNDLLEEFSLLLNRLQVYESNSTIRKVEEFTSFLLQRGHVMTLYPSLTYQEAANYAVGSSVWHCYESMEEKPSFVLKTSKENENKFLVSVLKGHKEAIISACPQSTRELKRSSMLATGSLDGRIKLWFHRSGLEKGNLKGHSKAVNCIDFVDNSLLTISSDGKMALWDAENFEERLVFSANGDSNVIIPGNCCRFVNEMNWMLSAWDDGAMRIGNMEGVWVLISEVKEHPMTCVNMVAIDIISAGYANGEVLSFEVVSSPTEKSCKTEMSHNLGTSDDLIEVFDILVYNDMYVVIGKQKIIRTQYTEDSNSPWAKNQFRNDPFVQTLVNEGMDLIEAIGKKMEKDMSSIGTFVMLRSKNGRCDKYVLEGLPTPHEYICGDLNFPYLVTGGSDGSVRIWRINDSGANLSLSLVQELGSHSSEVNRAYFISNGCQVVSVSDDTDVKLWNAEAAMDGSSSCKVSQTNYEIMGCSSEGCFLVTWGKRGLLTAWKNEKLLWTKICCSGEDITSARISLHGGKIMVGAQNYYELLNGETGSTYDVKRSCVGRNVRICDFSKDGREVLLGDNCDIRIVVVEPKMEPLGFSDVTWKAHDDYVNSAQFCSELYFIASGSLDGSIKIWSGPQECCLVVNIGCSVVSFSYLSSLNKLVFILEGDGAFEVEVSVEKHLQEESKSQGTMLDESNQMKNDNDMKNYNETQNGVETHIGVETQIGAETQNSTDVNEPKPQYSTDVNEPRPVTQSHLDQMSKESKPKEDNIQMQGSDNIPENWRFPMLQGDATAKKDLPQSLNNESVQASDLWGEIDLPPMSEEMLKNLENLQQMFMNVDEMPGLPPPPMPGLPPPPMPVHQAGPHRLLKKQTKISQYNEKREFKPKTTTVCLLDLNIDEPTGSEVVFKQSRPGLNSCILAKDCKTLYSSSYMGEVFVWRKLNGKWYDIARYVSETDTFLAEVTDEDYQIIVASKNSIQKLKVISN